MAWTRVCMLGNSQKWCWEMSFSGMGYVAPWGRGFSAVTAFFCCVTAWREMLEDAQGFSGVGGRDESQESGFSATGNERWEGGLHAQDGRKTSCHLSWGSSISLNPRDYTTEQRGP